MAILKNFVHLVAIGKENYFDHQTGGYVVTDKERIASGKTSKQEAEKFRKEQGMCRDLAQQGHKIEHQTLVLINFEVLNNVDY